MCDVYSVKVGKELNSLNGYVFKNEETVGGFYKLEKRGKKIKR